MATVDALAPELAQAEADEWQLRLELAAFYRLVDFLGWTEMILNHITLRVPGPEPQFLINPYGLNYSEVTASNLVKINLDGDVLDGSSYPVNRAGFVIHSAIHAARPDAHCIIHTHTTATMAVWKESGLRQDNFYSAQLAGQIAYHDFEGISTNIEERARLAEHLGDKSIMILRNHGPLVIGRHVPETIEGYWRLQRACEVQLAMDSMAGPNRQIRPEVIAAIEGQLAAGRPPAERQGVRRGQVFFDALLRRAGIRLDDLAGH